MKAATQVLIAILLTAGMAVSIITYWRTSEWTRLVSPESYGSCKAVWEEEAWLRSCIDILIPTNLARYEVLRVPQGSSLDIPIRVVHTPVRDPLEEIQVVFDPDAPGFGGFGTLLSDGTDFPLHPYLAYTPSTASLRPMAHEDMTLTITIPSEWPQELVNRELRFSIEWGLGDGLVPNETSGVLGNKPLILTVVTPPADLQPVAWASGLGIASSAIAVALAPRNKARRPVGKVLTAVGSVVYLAPSIAGLWFGIWPFVGMSGLAAVLLMVVTGVLMIVVGVLLWRPRTEPSSS